MCLRFLSDHLLWVKPRGLLWLTISLRLVLVGLVDAAECCWCLKLKMLDVEVVVILRHDEAISVALVLIVGQSDLHDDVVGGGVCVESETAWRHRDVTVDEAADSPTDSRQTGREAFPEIPPFGFQAARCEADSARALQLLGLGGIPCRGNAHINPLFHVCLQPSMFEAVGGKVSELESPTVVLFDFKVEWLISHLLTHFLSAWSISSSERFDFPTSACLSVRPPQSDQNSRSGLFIFKSRQWFWSSITISVT